MFCEEAQCLCKFFGRQKPSSGVKQLENALEFLRMAARLQLHNLYPKLWEQVRTHVDKTLLAELALDARL